MLNISTPEPDVQKVVQTEPPADAHMENQQLINDLEICLKQNLSKRLYQISMNILM